MMENNGSHLKSPRRGKKRSFSAYNGPGGLSHRSHISINNNNSRNSNGNNSNSSSSNSSNNNSRDSNSNNSNSSNSNSNNSNSSNSNNNINNGNSNSNGNNNNNSASKRRRLTYSDVRVRSSPRNKRAVNDLENSEPAIEAKPSGKAMTLSKYQDSPFTLHSNSSSPSSSPSSAPDSSLPSSPVSPDDPLLPLATHASALQGNLVSAKSKSRMAKRTTYKHVPHSEKPAHLVAKRNARERRRVQAVNSAFSRLRKHVPYEPRHKRLSKVKTLRFAIDYIQHLQELIKHHDQQLLSRIPSCGRMETSDIRPAFARHEIPTGEAPDPRFGATTGGGSGRFSSCASEGVDTRVRRSGVDSRRRRFLHSEANFLEKPVDHFPGSCLEAPAQRKNPGPHFPSCSSSLALTPTTPQNQAHPDLTTLVQETRAQVMAAGRSQPTEHSSVQPRFLGRPSHFSPPGVPSIAASAPDIPPCPSTTRRGSHVFPPTGSPHLPAHDSSTMTTPPYPSFLDCTATASASGSTSANGVVAMATRPSSIPVEIAPTIFSDEGRVETTANSFSLFDQTYLPFTDSLFPAQLDHDGNNLDDTSVPHSTVQPGQNAVTFSSLPLSSCAELTISSIADHMTVVQHAETFACSKVDSLQHRSKVQSCDFGWST